MFYLKGCNMRCLWCANPESVSPLPQTLYYPDRGGAAPAAASCPHGAVKADGLDRELCLRCGGKDCAKIWCDRRFELCGEELTTADIVEVSVASRERFGRDGGVTFGGGEPTLQMEALLDALAALKAVGVKTAVETNATAKGFERLFPLVDHLICDFKACDAQVHRRATGLFNARIKANLDRAAAEAKRLLVRVPLITGVNDGREFDTMVDWLGKLGKIRQSRRKEALSVQLLRMGHAGQPKYAALGQPYPMEGVKEPPRSRLVACAMLLKAEGLDVQT